MTAPEAAAAISRGILRALPAAHLIQTPMSDGGPGTAHIVSTATGGKLIEGHWRGPLGKEVTSAYALVLNGTSDEFAVIEAATTSGLTLVPEPERDPTRSSTYGVGQQIRDALARGVKSIVVGVGGTGSNDGGAGAAQALGYRLLDSSGHEIGPGGIELSRLDHINSDHVDPLLSIARIRIAVDVRNPLLGNSGATAIYGPQKGVTPELAPQLESALAHWAHICSRDLGVAITEVSGSGAGGGLAAGLIAVSEATIESGAELVGQAINLQDQMSLATLVVTGEGRLDGQTAQGKAVAYVSELAIKSNRPCLVIAGTIEDIPPNITEIEAAKPDDMPLEEALSRAPELVEEAAERLSLRYASLTAD